MNKRRKKPVSEKQNGKGVLFMYRADQEFDGIQASIDSAGQDFGFTNRALDDVSPSLAQVAASAAKRKLGGLFKRTPEAEIAQLGAEGQPGITMTTYKDSRPFSFFDMVARVNDRGLDLEFAARDKAASLLRKFRTAPDHRIDVSPKNKAEFADTSLPKEILEGEMSQTVESEPAELYAEKTYPDEAYWDEKVTLADRVRNVGAGLRNFAKNTFAVQNLSVVGVKTAIGMGVKTALAGTVVGAAAAPAGILALSVGTAALSASVFGHMRDEYKKTRGEKVLELDVPADQGRLKTFFNKAVSNTKAFGVESFSFAKFVGKSFAGRTGFYSSYADHWRNDTKRALFRTVLGGAGGALGFGIAHHFDLFNSSAPLATPAAAPAPVVMDVPDAQHVVTEAATPAAAPQTALERAEALMLADKNVSQKALDDLAAAKAGKGWALTNIGYYMYNGLQGVDMHKDVAESVLNQAVEQHNSAGATHMLEQIDAASKAHAAVTPVAVKAPVAETTSVSAPPVAAQAEAPAAAAPATPEAPTAESNIGTAEVATTAATIAGTAGAAALASQASTALAAGSLATAQPQQSAQPVQAAPIEEVLPAGFARIAGKCHFDHAKPNEAICFVQRPTIAPGEVIRLEGETGIVNAAINGSNEAMPTERFMTKLVRDFGPVANAIVNPGKTMVSNDNRVFETSVVSDSELAAIGQTAPASVPTLR